MSMPFEINKRYNFDTLAASLLGTNVKNALVVAIMGYNTARQFFPPDAQAINVYPLLPTGTPSDPKKYTYIQFESEQGPLLTLAIEWIDVSSVVVVSSQSAVITVNNLSSGDAARIHEALVLLGLPNHTIAVT